MRPTVSVLVPVRDAQATLAEALESVRAQSLRDLEVVLVDDGSTDRSLEVARAVFSGDPRLRVVSPGRVGLVGALQAGLAACTAALVARMDADDLAHPERLARQVAYLETHPEVSIVGSRVESFAERGLGGGFARYDAWMNGLLDHEAMVREIFVESPLAHPSVLFRRADVLGVGGYRDAGWAEDYDLWLRAARAGLRFGKVAEVLLRWRDHGGRATRADPRYAAEPFLRCKAHHLARGPLAGGRAPVIWGGKVGGRLARHLEAEGITTAAFVDVDPRRIGGARRGAPVLGPDALPGLRGRILLAAVGSTGARDLIRAQATAAGWREGADLFCVA